MAVYKKYINIDIYRTRVFFAISKDLGEESYLVKNLDGNFGDCDAICFDRGSGYPVEIWLSEKHLDSNDLLNTLAHETVHAVNFLFAKKGINLDIQNDEPQAYLTGFIFSRVYDEVQKYRKKCQK